LHRYFLKKIREKIFSRQYVVTTHADDEMHDDSFSIYDVEHVILTGEIVERQRDEVTGEWKYCIMGKTLGEQNAQVVAKLGPTDKLVIITVFKI
jgi:hypothetical protein